MTPWFVVRTCIEHLSQSTTCDVRQVPGPLPSQAECSEDSVAWLHFPQA